MPASDASSQMPLANCKRSSTDSGPCWKRASKSAERARLWITRGAHRRSQSRFALASCAARGLGSQLLVHEESERVIYFRARLATCPSGCS